MACWKSPSDFNGCIHISPYLAQICYKGEEYYHSLDTWLLTAYKKKSLQRNQQRKLRRGGDKAGRKHEGRDGEVPREPKEERTLIIRGQESVTGRLNHRGGEAERTWVIHSKILNFIKKKTKAQWQRGMMWSKSLEDCNTFAIHFLASTDTMEFSFG